VEEEPTTSHNSVKVPKPPAVAGGFKTALDASLYCAL